jgi:hypothetical protein
MFAVLIIIAMQGRYATTSLSASEFFGHSHAFPGL